MRVFFLDFDGVINNLWHYQRLITLGIDPLDFRHDPLHNIARENLDVLRYLIHKTDGKIVVSSTWRKDPYWVNKNDTEEKKIETFQDYFALHGWSNAPIIGLTPFLSGFRGEEVATWLDAHPEVSSYIILDDDSDFFLKNIKRSSIQLLDRVGLYGQDLSQVSKNWSNQKLYLVNKLTGLDFKDATAILKYFKIKDKIIKLDKDYAPYSQRLGFGYRKS